MTTRSTSRERYSFANLVEPLELPDLIAIQRESFDWFLNEGLANTFRDISPIKDFSEALQLELEFDPDDEDLRPPPKFSVEECKEKDMTYSAPVFVRARFMNRNTGEIKEQTVFMGDFPIMTEKGTFIVNGTERVVVSQLVRSPGVIFEPGERFRLRNLTKHQLVKGTIHPYRGEWMEFDVEQKPGKDVTAGTRVARKRRLGIFTLLRALGYDEEAAPGFLERFVAHFDFLQGQWDKERDVAPTQDEALIEIYKRARPGEPPTVESARAYFRNAFFESRRYDLSRVGRYKLNRKLGEEVGRLSALFGLSKDQLDLPDPDQNVLSRCEVLAAVTYMLHLVKQEPGYRLDDQDHFANRRIRSVGELIQNQVRIGLSRMERVVRERMTTQDVEAITPQTLINIRPVVAAIKEFFGTSQLSQFMDQVNPLSGLTHRRRLSALGPGGLSRERAGFEVRDVHFSHYGRMCPIETPEGPNIGLIGGLSTFARVNEFGFIESPYRKVVKGKVTGEIVYMAADEEENYVVAQANTPLNADGTFVDDRVLVRRSPQAASLDDLRKMLEAESFFGATTDIGYVPPSEVDYMDVSPKQIVSVGTALIPFLEHDDANRGPDGRQHAEAGRAAGALRGAVHRHRHRGPCRPRRRRPAPGAGGRRGHRGHRRLDHRPVQERSGARCTAWPSSAAPTRTRASTSGRGSSRGEKVHKSTILADGPSTDHGELALGKNLLVALMPWEGYNFEDAIILSERLVRDDVLTSIHIHEHEVDARDTKLGPEEITRDIPNLSDDILADLDDRGIIRVGAEVDAGDVLVGKVTPKGETELTPEERLLRAIFGEKAREVRDTSMKVPHGESGKVIDVKVFNRDDGDELPPGVNQLVRVYVAQKRKISVGDKLAGRHGNKGVISKILPVEDMPFLADGTPVDIILNPLGVPSRMNVGQVLEAHLGYCARWGWTDPDTGEAVGRGADPRHRVEDPPEHPAGDVRRHAGVRRRPLGRVRGGRRSPDDPADPRQPQLRVARRHPPDRRRRQDRPVQRSDGRALRQPDHGRVHVHPQAGPPRRRQDPRPLDRPVLDDHPAAAGRQGPVRRPALRGDGGVGARGLRRRLLPAGAAHHQVRRRARPGEGVRGHRQGRQHPRAGGARELQGADEGDAGPLHQRRGARRRRLRDRDARTRRGRLPRRRGARHRHLPSRARLGRRRRRSSAAARSRLLTMPSGRRSAWRPGVPTRAVRY